MARYAQQPGARRKLAPAVYEPSRATARRGSRPGLAPAIGSGAVGDRRGPRLWVAALVLCEIIAALYLWTQAADGSQLGFAVLGLALAATTHAVFVDRGQEFFSIWGLIAFVVTIGAGLRGLMIAFEYPDAEIINNLFLRGRTFGELSGEGWWTLASVVLLTLGYVLAFRLSRRRGVGKLGFDAKELRADQIMWISIAYAFLGFLGTALYIRGIGGIGATISARRSTFGSDDYVANGQFIWLARAGTVALLFVLAVWLARGMSIRGGRLIVLMALAVNALAINYVTTTRADVLYVALALLVIIQLTREKLQVQWVIGLALLVLLGIGGLSAARSNAQTQSNQAGSGLSINYAVNSGLLNRNGYDLSKTLLIMDAVPTVLPYENGLTIAIYAVAPIPRAIWSSKPVVSPGPIIGDVIYGTPRSGVPPGITAELVWNFGRVPALFLSFAAGLLLGFIERRYRPQRGSTDITAVLTYALPLLTIGKAAVGVSIGQAASAAAQAWVMIIPLYVIAAAHRSRSKRQAEAARRVERRHGHMQRTSGSSS